jgi:flagellar biosynthesis/type III secretory pathway protein FliH
MARAVFSAANELKKLKLIAEALPEDKQKVTEGLIADAAFMAEQLEKLRAHITENGWSEGYQNGANQFGKKSSVEADAYVKVQKSYASVIKQLTDLLPEQSETTAGAEIMSFLNKNE